MRVNAFWSLPGGFARQPEVDDLSDVLHFDNQPTDLHDESHYTDMFSPESAALGMGHAMTSSCPPVLAGYAGDTYLFSPQQGAPLYTNVAIDPSMIKYDPILSHLSPQTRTLGYPHAAQPAPHSQAVASGTHMMHQPTARRAIAAQNCVVNSLNTANNGAQPIQLRGVGTHGHAQRLASAGSYASSTVTSAQSPATSSGRRRHSTAASKQAREEEPNEEKMRIKKDIHNTIERRRRVNINERIKELSTMLPRTNDGDFKNHKGTVLKESVEYIKRLQRSEQQLRGANLSLQKRVVELEHMLRQQLTAGSSQPTHMEPTDLQLPSAENSFAFLSNVVKNEPSESTSATGLSEGDESPSESAILNESEQN